MTVSIAAITAEHHHSGFGLFTSAPRLSWRFNETTTKDWTQASYDLVITRHGKDESYSVTSAESLLVPWPSTPLVSRERATIKVRAHGSDGGTTDWASLDVEVALLDRSEWKAKLISRAPYRSPPPKHPFHLRTTFKTSKRGSARLYATAHGLYEFEINGKRVGDEVLAPGWQSYNHRLHYQTYDVTDLLIEGENTIGAWVAEGWFAGRLGRPGTPEIYGKRPALFAQLEVDGEVAVMTDESWEWWEGSLMLSEIYNGEKVDTRLDSDVWEKKGVKVGKVEVLPALEAELVAPEVAPVKRVMEVKPVEIITTPSGKSVYDFGQNLVGWLRVDEEIGGKDGDEVVIRFAEVLEHGELGVRPLRTAKSTDMIILGGKTKGWEPKFTFHGFRYVVPLIICPHSRTSYAEVTGHPYLSLSSFTAIVISSDIRRTGHFSCSHDQINKLHLNTVWSMRGNFVSVPTDCPQRDERLGWTGDIQVFTPTANFLYDTSAFLKHWLQDLEAEQRDGKGVVPVIVPSVPIRLGKQWWPMAIWADCAAITPWDVYQSFGDKSILETQFQSMCYWLDEGVPRDSRGFYGIKTPQYGDWLDPRAPPQLPAHGPTDTFMTANAYLVYTTHLVARIAKVIGNDAAEKKYSDQAADLLGKFRDDYITPNGRLTSDTQTAYTLGLKFGLFKKESTETAQGRLDWLIRWDMFKITTGFAGTPLILDVLAEHGMLNLAYRMLQENGNPSWLYPVSMGATTIVSDWYRQR